MSGHGIRVCQFGFVHGRCRCMDQTEIAVQCDNPAHAVAAQTTEAYQPKHLSRPPDGNENSSPRSIEVTKT